MTTQKSALLEELLQRARKEEPKLSGGAIIAAHFWIAALRLVADDSAPNTLSCLDTADSVEEFRQMKEALAKYLPSLDTLLDSLAELIAGSQDKSAIEAFLFGQMLDRAMHEVDHPLTAPDFLSRLYRDPPAPIKNFVPADKGAAPKTTDSALDMLISMMKPTTPSGGTTDTTDGEDETPTTPPTAPKKPVETPPAPKKIPKERGKVAGLVSKVNQVRDKLLDVVYGQDHAISAFTAGYFRAELTSLTNRSNKKPRATFLFAGPPGTGKTFLAEEIAQNLELPYCRFDMSEYADKEANIEFCGSDKVYKNGKAGNVTSFVEENPHCILLFDEVEKAHLTVIHLFLQILDAGRIRDNFTDNEVSFADTILIFTTNVGKRLYEDPTIPNLSTVSRKRIIKALSSETKPGTQEPAFPGAICSRFASGNVVMFNHIGAAQLIKIVDKELTVNADRLERGVSIKLDIDPTVPVALMFSEGAAADARTVKGRAQTFFNDELYELFRLLESDKTPYGVDRLETVKMTCSLDRAKDDVKACFIDEEEKTVLVLADDATVALVKKQCREVKVVGAATLADAKKAIAAHDVTLVLADVFCGADEASRALLNREDVESEARDFMRYLVEIGSSLPVYLLNRDDDDFDTEEMLSFAREGVRGAMVVNESGKVEQEILEACVALHRQASMLRLSGANRIISFKTAQTVSEDGTSAEIRLYDFVLSLAPDADDASKSVIDNVSRPNVHFDDVIGAADAKGELNYFIDYLKNPKRFMGKGVKAPKGVLLYGPPGTGKTLLAKAMAGESDVTFIAAEGNQFLKKFTGEGSDEVHALFNAARKYAPSILFIDEIDAIAKNRSGTGGAEDVLTAFLTEMDGFKTDPTKPIFVLAATNFDVEPGSAKSLDPALMRRFDRRIYIDLPNKEERRRFITMRASKNEAIVLSDEEIGNLAMRSTGMSLAQLDSIFELALRNAIRAKDLKVDDAVMEEAFETFVSGEEKKWDPAELERTARHEAGHTLVCWLSGERPSYVTVVARGNHGGYMQHEDRESKGSYSKEDLLQRIRTALAGRAAEIVYYGEKDGYTTGASGDLATATRVATAMLCTYGMDKTFGLGVVNAETANDALSAEVRERVNAILDEELRYTVSLIAKNRRAMDALVNALLTKNHLNGEGITAVLEDTVVTD
ncbi:MAG: AAA family ATPase [Clostridia bacterium]|nr:AAA family ATPase [Clostridia bacterium]